VAAVSAALIGASVGFLIFNLHPAKIFMGDTGSLFFGAITVGCAFSLGNPLIIAFVGIVYLIEGFSVILQVTFFKLTKKRIFKMAPIHHHFEKCGWSENKIVLSAIFLTLIVSLFAFAIFV
jgi:phospho-N-acetylmuramoyl-pentapeptide-transferase